MKKYLRLSVSYSLLILVMAALLYFLNPRLFRPHVFTPEIVSNQLDFPLSRVTVDLNKDGLKEIVNTSSWIECTLPNILSSSVKLTPKKGETAEKFVTVVNRNNYADKLDKLYKEDGFSWDSSSNTLTLPVNSLNGEKAVPMPTWILFELISDKTNEE